MSDLRIGISGWTYAPWRGVFYPPGLLHRKELEFASRQVNSIEINGSFYSLQSAKSYLSWHDQVPEDFVFAVKGGRYITHIRRLREIETPLANFFASGVLGLRQKLGPILWQFPPNMRFDRERFARFFSQLPRTTKEAVVLARGHSEFMRERAYLAFDEVRPIRHAIEIRHPSFETEEFVALLRENGMGLVIADTAGRWPYLEDVTTDFVYVRLHGDEEIYSSGYDDRSLDRWAEKIRLWRAGRQPAEGSRVSSVRPLRRARDVYVYFDNDVKVHAPFDAVSLLGRLTDFAPAEPMPRHPGMPGRRKAA